MLTMLKISYLVKIQVSFYYNTSVLVKSCLLVRHVIVILFSSLCVFTDLAH